VILGLLLLLALIIQLPAVQNSLVDRISRSLSERTGTEISVDRIYLGFFNTFNLQGLYVEDLQQDTLLYDGQLGVDLNMLALLRQSVEVNEIDIRKVKINLRRSPIDSTFNFQFLIDAFAGAPKPSPKEKKPSSWSIALGRLKLSNTEFRLEDALSQYELNAYLGYLQIDVDEFDLAELALDLKQVQLANSSVSFTQFPKVSKAKDNTESKAAAYPQPPLLLSLDRLSLTDNQFAFSNESYLRQAEVLDFNHLNLQDLNLEARQISWQADSLQAQIKQMSLEDHSGFKVNRFETKAFFGAQQIRTRDLLLRTPQTNIQLDYTADYADFSAWAQNLAEGIRMQFTMDNSSIAFQDLNYFAPAINEIKQINTGLTRTILAKATASGTLADLNNIDLNLSVANDLKLTVRGQAKHLTDPERLQYQLNLRDLSTSYEQLKNLTRGVNIPNGLDRLGKIRLLGRFRGGLDSLRGNNIELRTSSTTYFAGDLSARHLPSNTPVAFQLDIKALQTEAADLAGFSKPPLPAELYRLGVINYSGQIKGDQYDITSIGTLVSDAGAVQTNARIQFNRDYSDAEYAGAVQLEDFQLGYMLQDSTIGNASLALEGEGSGLRADSLRAVLDGTIRSFVFRDYEYKDLAIDGLVQQNRFEGNARFNDPNLQFDFSGMINLRDSIPALQFQVQIDTLNLAPLKLGNLPYAFSGSLESDFTGMELQTLDGTARLSDCYISNDTSSYYTDLLSLVARPRSNGHQLRVQAPFMAFSIDGAYNPAQLPALLRNYLNNYFPVDNLFPAGDQPDSLAIEPNIPPDSLPEQGFAGRLTLNKPTPLIRLFSPLLDQLDTATVIFDFSSAAKNLDLKLHSPHLMVAGQKMDSLLLSVRGEPQNLRLQLEAQQLYYGMDRPLSQLQLNSRLGNDSMTVQLSGLENSKRSTRTRLAFGGNATEENDTYRFAFTEDFFLNNQPWKINPANEFLYDNNALNIRQFSLTNQDQKIALRTEQVNTKDELAPLIISFNDFRVSEILKLLQLEELDYEGDINGFVTLKDYTSKLNYLADLQINNILLGERAVGNLNLSAAQDNPRKPLIRLQTGLDGPEGKVNAAGTYAINNQYLDLGASFEALRVRLLDPFLFGLIRESSGKVNGDFKIAGKANAPKLEGSMDLDSVSTVFGISGVRYTIPKETLRFADGQIQFETAELLDRAGNRALLDGFLDISDFGDVGLGLDFRTDRFQVLNTNSEDEDLYYGTLFVGAEVTLRGSALNPIIDMRARTLAPSQLSVQPLSIEQAVASQQDYIIYGNPADYEAQDSTQSVDKVYQLDRNGIDLTMNMEVTPAAELQVIIDPATGDKLVCRGNAETTVRMTPDGRLDILGNYRITDGRYALNYQGILKKDFAIEPGSRLDFVGDPLDTRFDVTAIYSTQTPTFELIRNRLTDENSPEAIAAKRRKQVNVILTMAGNLDEPDIDFDIQIPENGSVTSATRQELQRIRENKTELNKQVFSLLLLNSFLSQSSGGGDLADAGASVYLSSVSALLTKQLNRLADNYLKGVDVNIGIDSYQSAYDLGDQGNTVTELNLGVSKQLFDERLSLKVGGNVNLNSENSSIVEGANFSSIAGDFVLEYKLTEAGNVRLRVFRRDNYDVLNQNNVPQTGVGISFSKSFGDVNKKKEEKKK
jgi:hypothetical protein